MLLHQHAVFNKAAGSQFTYILILITEKNQQMNLDYITA